MVEPIEKIRLYSELRYRFEYLSKFLNFTQDDVAILNAFGSIVFPRIPVIADTVYRKLFSFDITKQYFVEQKQTSENVCPVKNTDLTLNSAQMISQKNMLTTYLKRVLTQREWNDTFLEYLSQIAKMHTNSNGSSSLNVDYMHINALLGYLEQSLIDLLWKDESIEDKHKHHMIMAINKLLWIQNDFFTMHYLNASKESQPTPTIVKKEPNSCCIIN